MENFVFQTAVPQGIKQLTFRFIRRQINGIHTVRKIDHLYDVYSVGSGNDLFRPLSRTGKSHHYAQAGKKETPHGQIFPEIEPDMQILTPDLFNIFHRRNPDGRFPFPPRPQLEQKDGDQKEQ